jgi:hypothetical protein
VHCNGPQNKFGSLKLALQKPSLEPSLAGDGWKLELNNHFAQFVKMQRDYLRGPLCNCFHGLDMYVAKLTPSPGAKWLGVRLGFDYLGLRVLSDDRLCQIRSLSYVDGFSIGAEP